MPSGVKTVQAKRNRNITNKIKVKESKVPPATDLISLVAKVYRYISSKK